MPSNSLSKIIDQYPSERRVVKRLADLVNADRERQLTLDQLYSKTGASSLEAFALILDHLVREGVVRRVFRVESPFTREGLGDFDNLKQTVRVFQDRVADQSFTPTLENVKVIYFLGKPRQRPGSGESEARPAHRGPLRLRLSRPGIQARAVLTSACTRGL